MRKNIVETVANLLAQAEHPGTDELEAQRFAAKAADLMARYELDEATVRATKGRKAETIATLDYVVSGQGYHGKWRGELVAAVVDSYGCKMVFNHNRYNGSDRIAIIVGTKTALEALEMLLPSVMLQAELNAGAKVADYMATQEETDRAKRNILSRDFRRSYLVGYGIAVGKKITARRAKIRSEYRDTPSAVVLVDDKKRVADAFDELFPVTGKVKAAKHNTDGLADGLRDGQSADTGEAKMSGKKTKQITAGK